MSQLLSLTTALAIVTACAAYSNADEPETKPTTIPLKDIWGYNIPGTRELTDVRRGPKNEYISPEGPLVEEIRRALSVRPPDGKAKPGFVVVGAGMDALREAHAVLVKNQKPRHVFPAGKEVSLVFFSYSWGVYVHLVDVQRQGEGIRVRYQFEPYFERISTSYFAIIPLGRLTTDKYQDKYSVRMVQVPMKPEYIQGGIKPITEEQASRIICQSFSFAVRKYESGK